MLKWHEAATKGPKVPHVAPDESAVRASLANPGPPYLLWLLENGMGMATQNNVDVRNSFCKGMVLPVPNVSERDEDVALVPQCADRFPCRLYRRVPKESARRLSSHAFGNHWHHDSEHTDFQPVSLYNDGSWQGTRPVFGPQVCTKNGMCVALDLGPKSRRQNVGLSVTENARIAARTGQQPPGGFLPGGYAQVSGLNAISRIEVETIRL